MSVRRNLRALAAQALAPVLAQETSLARTLPLAQQRCANSDLGLLQELVLGSARQAIYYRALLRPLLQRPQALSASVEALLLIGCHQLLQLRIPDHAALSETVEAAKQLGQGRSAGLINAVLRNLRRREEELVAQAAGHHHAHPDWLLQRLQTDWPEHWQGIVQANNLPAPLTLRCNRARATRGGTLEQLAAIDLRAEPTRYAPDGIRLQDAVAVGRLPGLPAGLLSVQDEAAQLAAWLLAPQAGERVLDACAAPGGKTAHLLELQPALSSLLALDQDAQRLQRVDDNLRRTGLADDRHRSLAVDATEIARWWDGEPFDAILLDAPCTGTGVIRRHPDIKLLRRETDVATTLASQQRLLDALWQVLKPGGRLLYATCSLLRAENEDQITAFLARQPKAQTLPLRLPGGPLPGLSRPQGQQLLPTPDGHDGFYYALLTKLPR